MQGLGQEPETDQDAGQGHPSDRAALDRSQGGPRAERHQQSQQRVGIVEPEHQDCHRRQREDRPGEQAGSCAEGTLHRGMDDRHRGHAHQHLREEEGKGVEPEYPHREAHGPQRGGWFVDSDRIRCVEAAEEEGRPTLRTGLCRSRIEGVGIAAGGEICQIGGRRGEQEEVFLNAGGVTVSYFEWLKNLSHVRFGRLQKRFEQGSNSRIVEAIEELTGKKLNAVEVDKIIKGPDEIDLVRSGLEETMINSYHSIRNEWKSNAACKNLRTAAFVVAINKIASDYLALGIFP